MHNPSKKAFWNAFLILLIPTLEMLWFRALFHFHFGKNLLSIGNFTLDVLVPLAIGSLILLTQWHIEARPLAALKIQSHTLRVHLIGLGIATLAVGILPLISQIFHTKLFFRFALAGSFLVFLTSFLVLRNVSEWKYLFLRYKSRLIHFSLGVLVLFSYPYILGLNWRILRSLTTYWTKYVLDNFWGIPIKEFMVRDHFQLLHPNFGIEIAVVCSGLEGIFYFLFAFSFISAFHPKLSTSWHAVWAYPFGIFLMFFVNIFRISAFFALGVYLANNPMPFISQDTVIWFFHINIGWVLYLAVLWSYLSLLIQLSSPKENLLFSLKQVPTPT